MDYDVALSFAGEDRGYAEKIAHLLRLAHVRVFYDTFEQAALWGGDLYTHLADIYSNRARYCVMLISEHYVEKAWTRHERRFAQERAFRADVPYILPVRLDDTPVPGLAETTGFLDLRRMTVETLVKLLLEKLAGSQPETGVDAGSIGSRAYAAAVVARYDDERLRRSLPLTVATTDAEPRSGVLGLDWDLDLDDVDLDDLGLHDLDLAGGEADRRIDAIGHIHRELVGGPRDFLVLLGGYGTGKTTLCKQILVHYCKRLLTGERPVVVPIYVDLRSSSSTFGSDATFADLLSEYHPVLPDVSDAEFLLLLDGYDEIARDRHSFSIATLLEKGYAGRRIKVLLTSRTHFFQTELDAVTRLAQSAKGGTGLVDMRQAVADVRAGTVYLLEFDDRDVQRYLGDRFAADAAAYYRKLLRIYDLNDLSRRPILLELISSVLPELDESDVISAASLYETAVSLWLQREAWRGVRPAAVISFMKSLATQMFLSEQLEINFDDLTSQVRARFEREILSSVDLERFDELIRTSTFISRDADGNFSFMHRSFMEYFFAEVLSDRIRQGSLKLAPGVGDSPAGYALRSDPTRVLGEGIVELLGGALNYKHPGHAITEEVSRFIREREEFREKERRVNRIANAMRGGPPAGDEDREGPLPNISMIGGGGRIYYDVEHREFLLVAEGEDDWTLKFNRWTTWIHT